MMPMQLRQFELRSKIASGGHGKVYRAFDTVLERMVAVKLMRKELENDPVALESFYREARACASLNHTNIIHIYAFDEFEGQRYLVMELADRGSLDSRIEKQGAPERTGGPGHRLQDRLRPGHGAQAQPAPPRHQAGQYPLQRRRRAQAGGFWPGAQRRGRTRITAVTEGTPYYVAPEKIKRERETFLSDMYSLGCTLYHALTGHVPFEAPSVEELVAAHVHTALTPPNLVVPEITQPTSDALVKVLAKNPADRFLSYDEFRMAFEAARSQLLVQRYTQAAEQGKGRQEQDELVAAVSASEGAYLTGCLLFLLRSALFFSLGPKAHRRGGHFAVVGRLGIAADWLADDAVIQRGRFAVFSNLRLGSDLVNRFPQLDGLGGLVHGCQIATEGMRRFLFRSGVLFDRSRLLRSGGFVGGLRQELHWHARDGRGQQTHGAES